jgi:hypothetical protein
MDEVQKPSNSEWHTPSSEYLNIYFILLVSTWHGRTLLSVHCHRFPRNLSCCHYRSHCRSQQRYRGRRRCLILKGSRSVPSILNHAVHWSIYIVLLYIFDIPALSWNYNFSIPQFPLRKRRRYHDVLMLRSLLGKFCNNVVSLIYNKVQFFI